MADADYTMSRAGNDLIKGFRIEDIEAEDIDGILDIGLRMFSGIRPLEDPALYYYFCPDHSISKQAVLDGKIIGYYLLNEEPVTEYDMNTLEDLSGYRNRKGLHALELVVLPEYRGLSYGRQLRDIPLGMKEYDYIWGSHIKCLNNLENWLRYGRRLVGQTKGEYVTLMDLEEKRNKCL
jgi:GNAT superfamily N-acetyltransferase